MYVIINGVSSDTIQGLQVLSLPPITKPKMRRQVDTIDGRAGDIITELGYEAYDRTITVLLHHNYDLDAITAFFNTSGEIIFSNEPDKKYYFRLLEKIDYERAVQFKTANITFHVQPYKYPVNETPLTVSSVEWEGTDYDQTPYIFRPVSDSSVEVGNREIVEQITGGTVAWNQLMKNGNFEDESVWKGGSSSNVTFAVKNNVGTVTALSDGDMFKQNSFNMNAVVGHKYLFTVDAQASVTPTSQMLIVSFFYGNASSRNRCYTTDNNWHTYIAILACTEMEYNMIRLEAPLASIPNNFKNAMVIDLTQMFGSTIADYIYSLEQSTAGAGVSLFKSLFPKDYYAYNAGELMSVKTSAHKTYDVDDNALGTYPLSNIELRGVPKLVNNKLTYDGDTYKADGSVTRRYGIVDLGTLTWNAIADGGFYVSLPDIIKNCKNAIASTLLFVPSANDTTGSAMFGRLSDKQFAFYQNLSRIFVKDTAYTTAESFKTAMSGVYLVYELATPTTESTTPYTETQICDADGTEEFIDDRDVQIPVGHKTKYMQINDPAEIIVPNAGNVPSAPTIQLTGSGTVGVYLGNAQTLQVNIPEDGITIDTEAQDATSNGQLANRSVTGDYDSVRLQPGDNDVSFSGDVSAVITKYTRWV